MKSDESTNSTDVPRPEQNSTATERAITWTARRIPRKSFLLRAGTFFAAAASGFALKGVAPRNARAAALLPLEPTCPCGSTNCGITEHCYVYTMNRCQSVYLRHCPGVEPSQYLGTLYSNYTLDVQSWPAETNGYYWGYSPNYGVRGWSLASCYTLSSTYC